MIEESIRELVSRAVEHGLSASNLEAENLVDNLVGNTLRRQYANVSEISPDELELLWPKVQHAVDWLSASIIANAPWLTNTDEQGIPKKLKKFASIDAVMSEILKQESRQVRQYDEPDIVEELEATLDSGYFIVRLKNEAALKREGALMQHCVGDGAYTKQVENGSITIFSLRDQTNKPHVTFRVDQNGHVVEISGKQNEFPLDKYVSLFRNWLNETQFFVAKNVLARDYIYTSSGLKRVCELAEGDRVFTPLRVALKPEDGGFAIPDNVICESRVSVRGCGRDHSTLRVGNGVVFQNSVILQDVTVDCIQNGEYGESLELEGCRISEVNGHTNVIESIIIKNTEIDNFLSYQINAKKVIVWNPNIYIYPSSKFTGEVTIRAAKNVTIAENCVFTNKIVIDIEENDGNIQISDGLVANDIVVSANSVTMGTCTEIENIFCSNIDKFYVREKVNARNAQLAHCSATQSILDNINVTNDLYILKCTGLDEIRQRHFSGRVFINDSDLRLLPSDLFVGESLVIYKSPNLIDLPEHLYVDGYLNVEDLRKATIYPTAVIKGSVSLKRCERVSIPEGYRFNSDLNLSGAYLNQNPKKVVVLGAIKMAHMPVEHITRNVVAASYDLRDAFIMDVSDLTFIQKDLFISARDIDKFAENIHVGGRLVVDGKLEKEWHLKNFEYKSLYEYNNGELKIS